MSMYEWASDLADERKAERKQRARSRRLAHLNAELLGALHDLLGDLEGAHRPSDDCPAYRADRVCERVKAGAL